MIVRCAQHLPCVCLGIALMTLIVSCGSNATVSDNGAVASFKDKHLTREMLDHYLPKDVSPKDSIRFAESFVKQWIKEQAVMDEALNYYPSLAAEVEYKVQDYKAKLIMHSYQNRIIEESLDKVVSKKEILAFYEANKQNFISTEKLYNYFYIVTNNRDNGQVGEWMRSNSAADHAKMVEWASKNALESKVDSTYVNEAKIELVSKGYYGNLQKTGPEKLIRWNGVIRGEKRYYLFKMVKIVAVGEPLAIELCRDKIIDLILNERKVSLIEKNEEMILKNARSNNSIQE